MFDQWSKSALWNRSKEMSAAALRIMAIDQKLADDHKGRLLSSLVQDLENGRRRLRVTLDAGVDSQEHKRLNAAIAAYDAGISLLPKLWEAQRG